MKAMDKIGLVLCKFQANLFEHASKQNASSKLFIKKFSYSSLAKRIDSGGRFLFESIDVPQAFSEVISAIDIFKGRVFANRIMSWIGYIYRYICYIYEVPMASVYKKIKPQELFDVYTSYHSLDNELAIKRILEAKNISFERKDNIELLKEIYLL